MVFGCGSNPIAKLARPGPWVASCAPIAREDAGVETRLWTRTGLGSGSSRPPQAIRGSAENPWRRRRWWGRRCDRGPCGRGPCGRTRTVRIHSRSCRRRLIGRGVMSVDPRTRGRFPPRLTDTLGRLLLDPAPRRTHDTHLGWPYVAWRPKASIPQCAPLLCRLVVVGLRFCHQGGLVVRRVVLATIGCVRRAVWIRRPGPSGSRNG